MDGKPTRKAGKDKPERRVKSNKPEEQAKKNKPEEQAETAENRTGQNQKSRLHNEQPAL